MSNRQIVLITGSPGSGKTSTLYRVLNTLSAQMEVQACLSEAIERNSAGLAFGFDLILCQSKKHQAGGAGTLCKINRLVLARRPVDKLGRVLMQPFVFEQSTFEAATVFFEQSSRLSVDSAKLVLALDEIGPLELNKHQGFMPLLQSFLRQDAAQLLLLTVRPLCFDQLHEWITQQVKEKDISIFRVSLDECGCNQAEKQIVDQAAMLNNAPG